MTFEIYHCFYFGQKRELRKEGIKIKKVYGKELTYLLDIPENMIHPRKGPVGGIMYEIYRNNYYLGYIYCRSLSWVPGFNVRCIVG